MVLETRRTEPKLCFFWTIVEVNDTCVCVNHTTASSDPRFQLARTVSADQLAIGALGLVVTILGLIITVNMTVKTQEGSKVVGFMQRRKHKLSRPMAFQMTVISLYNLLRMIAGLMVAVQTLGWGSRQSVQKISSLLWLLGTWGSAWTTLDLGLSRLVKWCCVLRLRWYKMSKVCVRAVFLLLLGFVVNGQAIAHIMINKTSDCSKSGYWWMYRADYSLRFLMASHFVLPQTLLNTLTLCLLIAFVIKRRARYFFVLSVVAWYSACNMAATICLLLLMQELHYRVYDFHTYHKDRLPVFAIAELLCYLNAASNVFLYFLWPRFRHEVAARVKGTDNSQLLCTGTIGGDSVAMRRISNNKF